MKKIKIFFFILLAIPLLMWIFWLLTPRKELVIAIVDKTVLTTGGQEHVSLHWILNQEKYTKNKTALYRVGRDYFGFFPKDHEQYKIRGLERFSSSQLDRLSDDAQVAYVTDTYGIYNREWYTTKDPAKQNGMLYGGLSTQDLRFLQQMQAKHKLVITEFNTIGSPTSSDIRQQFENSFGMRWTGWTARYFDSLDTLINKELPPWVVQNYKQQHGQVWHFSRDGLVFIHEDDRIEILETGEDLKQAIPYIQVTAAAQKTYHLPEKMKYPFWFDIVQPQPGQTEAAADFILDLSSGGANKLRKAGIPLRFPAILHEKATQPKFYYFSGDFCDNPISFYSSYFKGIAAFRFLFYNSDDKLERKSFFWTFYRPLITSILAQEKSR